ncbi:hypothetical protein DSO06_01770 [Candidatus Nezhaarchaeota archaeon WYZ-LMO8]|nr:MAG: hypothetical protein DSO06_01770 [Candidatus Nezhaarchaeota archaeon WYZ-LMO8]TDA36948.1 MAG: hypothetical protein DSO05_01680 [Candidatus Nezhaarchaeota archaeon WYZ-LMO7]
MNLMNAEKLLLNSMCGRLARWLRFLGFDVEYFKEVDDEALIFKAEETGRIIVTRDQDLHLRAVKRGVKSILLTSTNHVENMSKLLRELNIKIELPPRETRCPLCNNKLREVDPESVMHLLPSGDLARRYKKFWLCEKCGKTYWIGSHWRNIKKVLSQVEKCMEEG